MHNIPISVARRFLSSFDIDVQESDKEKVAHAISNHFEAIIYNLTGMAMAIALLNDVSKVEIQHLEEVRKYVTTQCPSSRSKQKGGASMPSDYFGFRHPNFSELNSNGGNIDVSRVQFENGIIRPAIQQGGSVKLHFSSTEDKKIAAYVRKVLAHHNASINKTALSELLHIIDVHIACLADDLKKTAPISLKQFDKVMKLKRHAIFH